MCYIHTSIVSRHLATIGNDKILRAHPPHINSSEVILVVLIVTPLPNSEQIYRTFSNHTYTKSTPKHTHHHYVPLVIPTHTRHTSYLQLHPHTHHIITHGCVDRPRRCDCTAGLMDGEAGWWTTSGNIGLPPLARVMGVGRQQQQQQQQQCTVVQKAQHYSLKMLIARAL